MTCSSVFTASGPNSVPSQHCDIIVTLIGQIEVASAFDTTFPLEPVTVTAFYSIGNQTISGTVNIDCSNCIGCSSPTGSGNCCNTCNDPQVLINGQTSPVAVCDGDLLKVQIQCQEYTMGILADTKPATSPYLCCVVSSLTLRMSTVSTIKNGVIKINHRQLLRQLNRNRNGHIR